MVRRSLCFISILLLCILTVSCGKARSTNKTFYGKAADNHEKEVADILPEEDQENPKSGNLNDTEANEVVQEEAEEALKENDSSTEDILVQGKVQIVKLIQEGANLETLREKISLYPAGTVLDTDGVKDLAMESLFYSEEISEATKERMSGKSYGEKCDIPYSELRYIRVLYFGFDGLTHIGELIVNQSIAEDIVAIFEELFKVNYPIERMVLVDEYDADDIASMGADNTSSFNYRNIDGTKRLSLHSYGMAIDINPLYNPFVREIDGKTVVLPENGTKYADRTKDCAYYIMEGDPCYQAFTERGFTWGGEWKNQKDYQHFQKRSVE